MVSSREVAQCRRLIAATSKDLLYEHFCCESMDDRTVFAGNKSRDEAVSVGQRDSHDVAKREMPELFSIRTPPDAAIRQHAVYIEGNRPYVAPCVPA